MMNQPLSKSFFIGIVFLLATVNFSVAEPQGDVVGFWSFELNPGFNLVAFPLLPDLPTPRDVIGSQLGAVEITTWDRGLGRYRWARYDPESRAWSGDLFLLDRGVAYWINLTGASEPQRLVVTGHPERYRRFRWSSLRAGWDFYAPTYGKTRELEELPPDDHNDLLISWNGQSSLFELAHATNGKEWFTNGFDRIYPDRAYLVQLNRDGSQDDNAELGLESPAAGNYLKESDQGGDGAGRMDRSAYENPPHPLVVSNLNGLPVCQPGGEICSGGFSVDVISDELH
ncbi:MAG TPA: hypothetical protein ENL08_01165, partial [Bacteroidetes bacterium]|nr:hypothetical protein [Bacteroidota bacterium]